MGRWEEFGKYLDVVLDYRRGERRRADGGRARRWVADDPRDDEGRAPGDHALWLLARVANTLPAIGAGEAFCAWWVAWAVWASFVVVFGARRLGRVEALGVVRRLVGLRDAPAYLTSGTAVAAVEWVNGYLRGLAVEALGARGPTPSALELAALRAVEAMGAFVVEGLRAAPCMWCDGDHGADAHGAAGAPAASPGAGVEVWGVRYRQSSGAPSALVLYAVVPCAFPAPIGSPGWKLVEGEALGVPQVMGSPPELLRALGEAFGWTVEAMLSPDEVRAAEADDAPGERWVLRYRERRGAEWADPPPLELDVVACDGGFRLRRGVVGFAGVLDSPRELLRALCTFRGWSFLTAEAARG